MACLRKGAGDVFRPALSPNAVGCPSPVLGVEGRDTCIMALSNTTGDTLDIVQAEADCVARGGHLATSAQSTWGQGGVLDLLQAYYPDVACIIGGYR